MNAAPLVSVLIPTHNRAHLLGRAIGSVQRQTMPDFEIIVVDDGSDDDPVSVVASLEDPRIRVVTLTARAGCAAARNRGIEAARGEFIAFLDSDDEWLPTKLGRQIACIRDTVDPCRTVVYTLYTRHDTLTGRHVVPRRPAHEGDVLRPLLRGWTIALPVALVSRSLLVAAGGFDETLPVGEDYELWLRLSASGVRFAVVKEPLTIVHHHSGPQLSADSAALVAAVRRLDAKWGAMVRTLAGPAGYRRWRAGKLAQVQVSRFMRVRELRASGNRLAAWRVMLRIRPWPPRLLLQALFLTILGQGAYGRLATAARALRVRHE